MALAGKVCNEVTKMQDLKEIKEGKRECWGSDEGRGGEEAGKKQGRRNF